MNYDDDHVVSLKEYTDARLAGVEKRLMDVLNERQLRWQAMHDASERAVEKSETSLDRRLGLLNEFRAQAADESRKYVLAEVLDQQQVSVDRRIKAIEVTVATLQGRAIALAGFGAITGGSIAALVAHFLAG